jgi:predicted Zn-dependent protease
VPITQAMPSEAMPSAAAMLAEAERLFECGRVDEARERFESLLSSADGDPWLEAQVLGDLAVMATYAGERAQAADLASQAPPGHRR